MRSVTVDLERCCGHGLCEALAPSLFAIDDDGYCVLKARSVDGEDALLAEEAVRACPTEAIALGDVDPSA